MAKPTTTIENRVYLFREIAAAFVSSSSELLASSRPDDRARALRALADIAYVSCVVADTGSRSADEVRRAIAGGGLSASRRGARAPARSRGE